MAEPPPDPDPIPDGDVTPEAASPPGMPRWVKTSVIVLIVLALVAVVVLATGIGGPHGPSRHDGADAAAGVAHISAAVGDNPGGRTATGGNAG